MAYSNERKRESGKSRSTPALTGAPQEVKAGCSDHQDYSTHEQGAANPVTKPDICCPSLVRRVAASQRNRPETQEDLWLIKRKYRARRVYVQLRTGMEVAMCKGLTVSNFALSSSDAAMVQELEFGKAFNTINRKMHREYPEMGYVWIEHVKEETGRFDRHVIVWAKGRLDLAGLGQTWEKHFESWLPLKRQYREVIEDAGKAAAYFSRYCTKEGFQRARFSYNWVFPGWFDYSRYVVDHTGEYPSTERLAALSEMSPRERLADTEFRWSNQKRQERLMQRLNKKMFGESEQEAEWKAAYLRNRRNTAGRLKLEGWCE